VSNDCWWPKAGIGMLHLLLSPGDLLGTCRHWCGRRLLAGSCVTAVGILMLGWLLQGTA